jgi:protein-tyrosine kinase
MSRIYETLRRMKTENRQAGADQAAAMHPAEVLHQVMSPPAELANAPTRKTNVLPGSRLVALTNPRCLGAEKFRSLVTRLENVRSRQDLRSLQVTSTGVSEGKTLVAANLALTLAKHFKYQVLLVEGDMHRATLSELLGLTSTAGLSQWWSGREGDEKLARYVERLEGMPLWFLSAGAGCDHPSQILQSGRFAEAFEHLVRGFDWVIVDSTPILPVVDANLWARLVDGSLLVVRERLTPARALKKALETLDNPKLVGMVLNEATDFDRINYSGQYYAYAAARQGDTIKINAAS